MIRSQSIDAAIEIKSLTADLAKALGLLRDSHECITWMTGCGDFNPGGKAQVGFDKDVRPVLSKVDALLAQHPPKEEEGG